MIHIYMEMSQGNSLCSCLKQKNTSFFFFFLQNQKRQEGRTGPVWRSRVDTSGREEEVDKQCGRVNIAKYCVHMYVNEKMIPVEIIAGMRIGG
jgi:hypothetical protein